MKKALYISALLSTPLWAKDFRPQDNLIPIRHIDYQCVGVRQSSEGVMKFAIGLNIAQKEVYEGAVDPSNNAKVVYYAKHKPVLFKADRCIGCFDILLSEGDESLRLQMQNGTSMKWTHKDQGKVTSTTLRCQAI